MTEDELYCIKRWDDQHCLQHVISFFSNYTSPVLNKFYSNQNITYIDIGANVGKVYDLVKKQCNIDHAYLIEGNELLCEYMKQKYQNDTIVSIHNSVVLDIEDTVSFNNIDIGLALNHNKEYINLGTSQINQSNNADNLKQTIQLSKFLDFHNLINKKMFIKIDTENSDFLILKDLLSIISRLAYKPIIEFEINYSGHGLTDHQATNIIQEYITKHKYKNVDIFAQTGDGLLVPEKNGIN